MKFNLCRASTAYFILMIVTFDICVGFNIFEF